MSKGLKAIIVITLVAVIMVIGLIVISKTSIGSIEAEGNSTSVTQNEDVLIKKETQDASGDISESATIVYAQNEETLIKATATATLSATPSPTPIEEPIATAIPTPEVPESVSDDPQFATASNMNGYIYISYKSEKRVKIMMNNGDQQEIYDLIPDGQYHRFTLHLGDGHYLIRLVENTTGNSYRVVDSTEFDCTLIDENFPYLVPNSFVVYDNAMEVIQFGLELTENAETQEEKAHAIYDWIVRNISYDFSVVGNLEVGYVPNPQITFDTRKGICSDFAVLFASMCRSQGIPCKVVLGYYIKTEYYHAWNEVLVNGEYVIVDTSGDSQTKQYNFSRTEGYTPNKEN